MSQKKRGFNGTYVFLGLVVILAGYSAYTFKHTGPDNDTPTQKHLFEFQPKDVVDLKITGKDENFELKREKDGWEVVAPYHDLADPSAVDAVLYSIQIQKGRTFRTKDDDGKPKWAEFGLEPPGYTLEVKTAKGSEKLELGSKNAFDGSFYLRSKDELLLGDKSMAQAVLRDPKNFRSRLLFRDADAEIHTMDVTYGKIKYKVTKIGDEWTLEPKPPFAVDKIKIEKWIVRFMKLQPQQVVSETQDEAAKRDGLLLKPSLVVTAHSKKADGQAAPDWTLTVGQDKDQDVYMYTNQLPAIYETASSVLADMRVGPEYFRDGNTPFQFDVEKAREVEIHSGDFKHTLVKADLVWKVKGEDLECDQDKLIALMQKIRTLDAAEFMPLKAAKGFKPEQTVVVRDAEGKTLLNFAFGDSYKARMPYNKGQTLRYVKTNLDLQEAMGVPTTKLTDLVDKSMVHAKAKAAAKAEQKK